MSGSPDADEAARAARMAAKQRWKDEPGNRYSPEEIARLMETEVQLQQRDRDTPLPDYIEVSPEIAAKARPSGARALRERR